MSPENVPEHSPRSTQANLLPHLSEKIVAQGSIRSSCKEKSASGPGFNLMEAQLKATHRLTMEFSSP